ncbi:Hint domain-containing protein [Roseovarius atlanticus]|uniref:Hint domain-containing protein n=1 Tax=Roseovarius atlanticus TaxID=1641875 RepID=UPI00070A41BC|nr:Hint domain-containing protein [Roseovarius atlanticus]
MGTPTIATSLSVARNTDGTYGRTGTAQVPPAARSPRPMRKFQMAYLRPDGTAGWTDQIAPATPIFDSAFSAFSHGTLLHTPDGQVAVQDLEPGMSVSTAEHGPSRVLWIGSMTLVPAAAGLDHSACRLTRIMPDTFGLGRPEANLTAGPGARILSRPPGLRDSFGRERVLTPASDLVDGMNVIELVPPRPVTVYHLCLRHHAILRASGIEVESFHPGPGFERAMGPNMLALFLSLFPHVKKPADFGSICHPRLPLQGLAS